MPAPDSSYLQTRPRNLVEFDLSSVRAAESTADDGDLRKAASLCERILQDDRVRGTMAHRTSWVRLPLAFEAMGDDDSSVEDARELLDGQGLFWRMFPPAELLRLATWYVLLGVAVARWQWVDGDGVPLTTNGVLTPRLETWHPDALRWSWFDRCWYARTGHGSVEVPVTPGEDGWVLLCTASNSPWRYGLWRALGLLVVGKRYAWHDMARAGEKYGLPGLVLKPQQDHEAPTKQERRELARNLETATLKKGLVLPDGWDLDVVEVSGGTGQLFQRQIDLANKAIAIAIAGQNLTSEVAGGSYAAATVHGNVAAHIVAVDVEAVSSAIYEQCLRPWAELQLGSADAAPWPAWDASPPEDDKTTAEGWKALGEAIAALTGAGLRVDAEALAEKHGIPLLEQSEDAPEDDDDDAVPDDEAEGRAARSLSEMRAAGFVEGSSYADAVTDHATRHFAESIGVDVAAYLDIIAEAESYDDVRERCLAHYGAEVSPEELAEMTERAFLLAQVAGVHAVREDAKCVDFEDEQ